MIYSEHIFIYQKSSFVRNENYRFSAVIQTIDKGHVSDCIRREKMDRRAASDEQGRREEWTPSAHR